MVWKDIERKMGHKLEKVSGVTAGGGTAVLEPHRFQTRGSTADLIGGSGSAFGSDAKAKNSAEYDPTKGSQGMGSFLNKPIFDSQQRIQDASQKINEASTQTERDYAINELRKEEEFLKNLLGVQLDLDILVFKIAKAIGQALGQIVL